MKRKEIVSQVWNFVFPEQHKWLDAVFVILTCGLGSTIVQKKGLLLGAVVATSIMLLRSTVCHFVFRRSASE